MRSLRFLAMSTTTKTLCDWSRRSNSHRQKAVEQFDASRGYVRQNVGESQSSAADPRSGERSHRIAILELRLPAPTPAGGTSDALSSAALDQRECRSASSRYWRALT